MEDKKQTAADAGRRPPQLSSKSLLADLARFEFPDFEILRTWPIPQSLNAIANGQSFQRPVASERQKVFDAWRAEHEAMPKAQIEALLEKARASEARRLEEAAAVVSVLNEAAARHRTTIDWKFWSNLQTVKIWEAAALYAGLNPEAWSFESISAARSTERGANFERAFNRLARACGPQGPVALVGEVDPMAAVSLREAASFLGASNGEPASAGFVALAGGVDKDEQAPAGRATGGVTRHSTVRRREDNLAPAIGKAEELAGAGASPAAVWVQLQRLASSSPSHWPLIDVVQGGVRYWDDIEEKTLTRKQLGDRLRRARERDSAR